MSTLTEHAVVLRWYESMNQGADFFVRDRRALNTGPQMFVTEENAEGDYAAFSSGTVLRMEYETWQDMGGPTEITVTVRPGDHLNDKD